MTIQLIDPTLCHPNQFQPTDRVTFTPGQLADLESIKEKMLMPPKVRPHPRHPGEWEICYGHRRTAAWILYRPGELMPADVCELSDWDLFAEQAIENGQRQNLNAIQKALTIQIAMTTFGKTQLEAGKLVGLATQGAVSHLLALLKLPDEIKTHVATGAVPERIARQLIKSPDALVIAAAVARARPAEKDAMYKQLTAPPAPAPPAPAIGAETPKRKDKPTMTHKSAHTLKPIQDAPPMPPKVRREIVNMAQAAAAIISNDNPKRKVILKGIARLCKQWKVGLPDGWDSPASVAKKKGGKV